MGAPVALVRVTAGGDTMMRQVLGATSAHGQDNPVPHFGLGTATTATSVVILWPSGIVDILSDVPADQVVTVSECNADLDGDGAVGVKDLLILLGVWGPCKDCPADFNRNDAVGVSDLLALLANWGACP
ncbi:MAG: ASPIC/UnbV domain-containing protein [Planctomycetes bacterium]|nr:ASPIC/UnbV domain-containing protein [Planctomycetota bacterium]